MSEIELKEETIILELLEQLNTSVERENLSREMNIYQKEKEINIFDIKQRTPKHFYCPELGGELRKMLFRGLISLKMGCKNNDFGEYYSITKFGKDILKEIKRMK